MKIIVLKLILLFSLSAIFVVITPAQNASSFECVRAKPVRILSKKIFPKTTFRLKKNKSFPFEYIGFETVKLKNGDNLIIKNYGCENYSLDFRFATSRLKSNLNRTKFWYQSAARLMDSVLKGLIKNVYLPRAGTKALKEHIRRNVTLRFDDYVYFLDTEIKEVFHLAPVRKSKNGKYIVEISFGIGPL